MEDQEQEKKEEAGQPVAEDKQPEECQKKCEEYLNGWKRAKADFINYKREEFERTQEMARYAKENFLESILPILDNLNLTASKLPEELAKDAHVRGLLMTKTQLEDFLKAHGVEAIDSLGKNFDPAIHEVIQAVESKEAGSGTIVEEVEKGYTINGRLLRPAKVKVAK